MIENNTAFDLESENIEIDAFVYALFLKYGYDFKEYSFIHIKRRVLYLLSVTQIETISGLQSKMLYDKSFFYDTVLPAFSVNVTEMFRDPLFYKKLRTDVIPNLMNKKYIKIWHAGCSTGAEVYSMAILLKEAGIYDRCQLYATDFNEKVLNLARRGVIPIDELQNYTRNYQKSGGLKSFSEYYSIQKTSAVINKELLSNVVFSTHNLVSDGVFGEMDLIMCRNVLIYFTKPLQKRAIKLFSESIISNGILCLGTKEKITREDESGFDLMFEEERIYIKAPKEESN